MNAGISTRDWFAGQALVGLMAQHENDESGRLEATYSGHWRLRNPDSIEALAYRAFEIADAMNDVGSKTNPTDANLDVPGAT